MKPRSNPSPGGHLQRGLAALARDEQGVTAIEYALVASLIALACLAAITGYANALNNLYEAWVIPTLQAILNALGG